MELRRDGEIETELGGVGGGIETGIAESRRVGLGQARRDVRAGPENVLK